MINMKYLDLFSLKNIKKELKRSSAAVVIYVLRVKNIMAILTWLLVVWCVRASFNMFI